MAKQQPSSDTEYLSTYIRRIEEALENLEDKQVITSRDVPEIWLGSGNVKRLPILWRLYEHTMFYITTIEPGAQVDTHSHPENVFRYVIKGSIALTAGGQRYDISEGMW